MGVNFSAFEIGRRALTASQLGLTVAGQNIANVNTPGYSRQSVQLAAVPTDGANLGLTGNGVTIQGVQSFRDRFIQSRLQTETAITGRLTAQQDALAPVDAAFNSSSGSGIDSALSGFFGSFRQLEADPVSVPQRVDVIDKANQLASAFGSTRAQLVTARSDADGSLRAAVDDANGLAKQVADLNVKISTAERTGSNAAELRDQRDQAMNKLAETTGARAVENPDGMLTVTLGDGQAIVSGGNATPIQVQSTPPDGLATLLLNGQPAAISDGKLRGLLDATGMIGGQIDGLDQLAASVASRVNTLHASGTDLDGNNGTNFFNVPAGGAPITAANLAVSSAISANPRMVVASPLPASSSSPTVAGAIAGLLSDPTSQVGTRTGSFSSIYSSMVSDAGNGVKNAADALATQQAILTQTQGQRDALSGVSLDEEAINLLQYQKSYQAAARFLKIADEMTQTIMTIGQ